MRTLSFDPGTAVCFRGENRSLAYARRLLSQLGVRIAESSDENAKIPLVVAGGSADDRAPWDPRRFVVRLWDFQVGRPGTGLQASVVSGVSCVLGVARSPPLALPAQMPERWCGTLGAAIAMSALVQQGNPEAASVGPQLFDISSADLRSFADQNFANHKEFPDSWRRNGRVTLEHGGIYPQGFFPCKDGFVAVVGRSKADWEGILGALGSPSWAQGELLDPVHLATHPELVDDLFYAELSSFTRDELLAVSLRSGATIAPVYTLEESSSRGLVPADLFDGQGEPALPFFFTT